MKTITIKISEKLYKKARAITGICPLPIFVTRLLEDAIETQRAQCLRRIVHIPEKAKEAHALYRKLRREGIVVAAEASKIAALYGSEEFTDLVRNEAFPATEVS